VIAQLSWVIELRRSVALFLPVVIQRSLLENYSSTTCMYKENTAHYDPWGLKRLPILQARETSNGKYDATHDKRYALESSDKIKMRMFTPTSKSSRGECDITIHHWLLLSKNVPNVMD